MVPLSVFLLLTLSGCANSGRDRPTHLAPLPADLPSCFEAQVDAPQGSLSKAQVMLLIANLKRSDAEKTLCGKRLIEFYESQASQGSFHD